MTAYEAICFDLDRTLCEPTQDATTLLESAFDRAGVDPFCTPTELRAVVPSLPTAQTDQEFYRNLFAEAASRADVDPAVSEPLTAQYLEVQDPTAVRFRPGAKRALEHAREHGPVGLITNGGRPTQTKKLEALDIADAFDVRIFTDPSAGIEPKPSTVPFERALSDLDVAADAAVHVGDSLHADIAGANAVGLDSAWVDTGHDTLDGTPHRPTYELTSLEAFETIM